MKEKFSFINENEPVIVSVSRRTDVPAFHSNWLLEQMKKGFVLYNQPYTQKKIAIQLNPEYVAGYVFWSKNYGPFLPHIRKIIDSYRCYFHYTITGYGRSVERLVPQLDYSLKTCFSLSEILRPSQLIWRYDPIIITEKLTPKYHLTRFTEIAHNLESKTNLCIISFVHMYKKIQGPMKNAGLEIIDDVATQLELAENLKNIAAEHGISVEGCCSPKLQLAGVMPAACISQSLFRQLYSDFPIHSQKKATRKNCLCDFCHDIGRYNSCKNGCCYCYAMNHK